MEWNDTANQTSGMQSSGAQSSGTMDGAKEKARQAASDAQHKVSDQLRMRADTTRTRAADALGSVAQALTNSAEQLRSDNPDQGAPVDYVERAGNQIRRASDYLRNTNTDDIVRGAEDFARRQPAIFLGGALVLGFLAARLVKSTQGQTSGGSIPHDRALVPRSSMWATDRETPVTGFREPSRGAGFEEDNDPSFTRQFGRDTL
jgi:hypothetical protein